MHKTVVCAALAIVCGSSTALRGGSATGPTGDYSVALTAGEFARVIVEQRGVDIVVEVRDPDGHTIADVQDDIRRVGEEQVEIVAERTGTYTVMVTAARGMLAADSYAVRVDAHRVATDADRAMQDARSARAAAVRLERSGRFDEARALFERALRTAEAARGPDDVSVGLIAFDLAGNALEARENSRAESLYQRAIAVLGTAWGTANPYSAMARSRLGLLYQRKGENQRAEALVRDALADLERSLGTDHVWFVRCLMTLANLRADAGDSSQAEEMQRRALAIVDTIHEAGTILHASVLSNLADLRRQKRDYESAEDFYTQSLRIGEAIRGPNSYFVSTALQNLGVVARERENYAAALDHYNRALAIRERLVGADHPDVAQLLNNLANIYQATGDTERSLETHRRALRIWEMTAGPYARGTLTSLGNLARTYAAAGDIEQAVAFQRRTDAAVETQLALNLAVGSERQKLAFVASTAERTDRTISLHLDLAPENEDAAGLAALVLLQRKGRVLDAMTDVVSGVRSQLPAAGDRALLDRLNDTTAELARVALAPNDQPARDRRDTIASLEARREELEAALSAHSAEFRVRHQPITLAAVQAAIPADAALLEFAVFRSFDPAAERTADAYGAPHYAAYVLRQSTAPFGVDLGTVAAIDRLVGALREALLDPNARDVKERARALDEQIMRPLRTSIGDAARLLVSPDGRLNLVPFEALVDEGGAFLIERYGVTYLTTGRDLVRMHATHESRSEAIIFADPLFGEPRAERSGARPPAAVPRQSVMTSAMPSTLYFAPLSATAAEARAIKALFPDATLLTGAHATKAALQRAAAPRMLHIASHGFFVEDSGGDRSTATNPLVRSGLAFAGANLTRAGQSDGILTALEAAGLDLRGTKLVTLSACDTAVGEVRDGEGVFGLRRAFELAGAETLVMSLWPVSDYIAREAMVAFYTGLEQGLGRGDALRSAKLAMLKRPARRHPFYWASFIQSGEWAALDGTR